MISLITESYVVKKICVFAFLLDLFCKNKSTWKEVIYLFEGLSHAEWQRKVKLKKKHLNFVFIPQVCTLSCKIDLLFFALQWQHERSIIPFKSQYIPDIFVKKTCIIIIDESCWYYVACNMDTSTLEDDFIKNIKL